MDILTIRDRSCFLWDFTRFPSIKLHTFVVKFSNSFPNHPSWDQRRTFRLHRISNFLLFLFCIAHGKIFLSLFIYSFVPFLLFQIKRTQKKEETKKMRKWNWSVRRNNPTCSPLPFVFLDRSLKVYV